MPALAISLIGIALSLWQYRIHQVDYRAAVVLGHIGAVDPVSERESIAQLRLFDEETWVSFVRQGLESRGNAESLLRRLDDIGPAALDYRNSILEEVILPFAANPRDEEACQLACVCLGIRLRCDTPEFCQFAANCLIASDDNEVGLIALCQHAPNPLDLTNRIVAEALKTERRAKWDRLTHAIRSTDLNSGFDNLNLATLHRRPFLGSDIQSSIRLLECIYGKRDARARSHVLSILSDAMFESIESPTAIAAVGIVLGGFQGTFASRVGNELSKELLQGIEERLENYGGYGQSHYPIGVPPPLDPRNDLIPLDDPDADVQYPQGTDIDAMVIGLRAVMRKLDSESLAEAKNAIWNTILRLDPREEWNGTLNMCEENVLIAMLEALLDSPSDLNGDQAVRVRDLITRHFVGSRFDHRARLLLRLDFFGASEGRARDSLTMPPSRTPRR